MAERGVLAEAGAAGGWSAVLDELDGRLRAAEAGRLEALGGWERPADPAAPMSPAERDRAAAIVSRQGALIAEVRARQAATAAAQRALRRQPVGPLVAAPVYLDRLG